MPRIRSLESNPKQDWSLALRICASIAESVGERYLQSAGNALFAAQNGPKMHADMR